MGDRRVATIAHYVNEDRIVECAGEKGYEEAVLGVLLGEAVAAIAVDGQQSSVEATKDTGRLVRRPCTSEDLSSRRFGEPWLKMVRDARNAPDAVAEKRRARAGRPEDEDGRVQPGAETFEPAAARGTRRAAAPGALLADIAY
jgi:hypothetical protein